MESSLQYRLKPSPIRGRYASLPDWSERRHHLAHAGAAVMTRFTELKWPHAIRPAAAWSILPAMREAVRQHSKERIVLALLFVCRSSRHDEHEIGFQRCNEFHSPDLCRRSSSRHN